MKLTYGTARRWTACPASATDPPADWREPVSDTTLEGRAAQAVARILVRREVSCADELVGRVIDGAEVTEDAARMGGEFAAQVLIEGGTVTDEFFYAPPARILRMDCGWTVREPQADPQLVFAMANTGRRPEKITLTLFQPRPYHPAGKWRHWTLYEPQIEQWCKWLAERVEQASTPQPAARPGEHCRGCPHRSRCRATALTSGSWRASRDGRTSARRWRG